MKTLSEIRQEIERATERRAELWHALSEGHDSTLVDELKQVDARLAGLWDEHREARAQLRFGERESIIKRARTEERLSRAA
jgi:hypothetical protein